LTTITLPELNYHDWVDSKDNLHLMTQIIGKIRMKAHPKLNHWWHVTLYPTARGLTTGRIPYQGMGFAIDLDCIDHCVSITRNDGAVESFEIAGLTIAEFYRALFDALERLDISVEIHPVPFDHKSKIPFDQDHAERPYDRNAVTRFSGRAHPLEAERQSDREAYSHEVISIGFWPGDDSFPEAAFYGYAYPDPEGLRETPLEAAAAEWTDKNGSAMAILRYNDWRTSPQPAKDLLGFMNSVYDQAARLSTWPIEDFKHAPTS